MIWVPPHDKGLQFGNISFPPSVSPSFFLSLLLSPPEHTCFNEQLSGPAVPAQSRKVSHPPQPFRDPNLIKGPVSFELGSGFFESTIKVFAPVLRRSLWHVQHLSHPFVLSSSKLRAKLFADEPRVWCPQNSLEHTGPENLITVLKTRVLRGQNPANSTKLWFARQTLRVISWLALLSAGSFAPESECHFWWHWLPPVNHPEPL